MNIGSLRGRFGDRYESNSASLESAGNYDKSPSLTSFEEAYKSVTGSLDGTVITAVSC